jgi:hypothetical protein
LENVAVNILHFASYRTRVIVEYKNRFHVRKYPVHYYKYTEKLERNFGKSCCENFTFYMILYSSNHWIQEPSKHAIIQIHATNHLHKIPVLLIKTCGKYVNK